jgi:hypothetical protein
MKNLKTVLGISLSMMMVSTELRAGDGDDAFDTVIEIAAPLKGVFIPKGFDSNDNVEVVVAGAYPNSCYKVGPTRVAVDTELKVVHIEVNAYYSPNTYCLMLYIPFTQVIPVGVLRKGDYQVIVNGQVNEYLPVAKAKKDQMDDFLYATVVGVNRKSKTTFELQGVMPSSCARLDEIRVIEEPGNVLAVLPILKMEAACEPSNEKGAEFLATFQVPAGLKGLKLIHIRSLNGASINQVVEF